MGQNQRNDDEEMPRCIVSDPAQPHNFSLRVYRDVSDDCAACAKDTVHLKRELDILRGYYPNWSFQQGLRLMKMTDEIFQRAGPGYYCRICDLIIHEACLKKPSKIIHPYHPQHPLVFTVLNYETGIIAETSYVEYIRLLGRRFDRENSEDPEIIETKITKSSTMFDICTWCGNDLKGWFYRCKICNFCLDFHCASKFPPMTIQDPKSHHHSLTLFPRPLSFPCNACGLINDVSEPSYACHQCTYVVHQSCIDLPRVIKITRHPHRLSHTPYLPAQVFPCRICYKNVDIKYGQYSCNNIEDCSYVAHSKCATHEKIWDGVELEWEDEESDEEDIAPYKTISDGLIEHCWHDENHYLKLEKYDSKRDIKKQCQACMRSIMSHDFYSCIECDFFLHEVCANLPRKVNHALHIHPLFMDSYPIYDRNFMMLSCSACYRLSNGLKYRCRNEACEDNGIQFQVDVNCILVPECSTHESHADHSLFISTFLHKDNSQRSCKGCKSKVDGYHLQCVSCEFAICYNCATIPHEVYHKYDEDALTLCYGENGVDDKYWCEACERRLDPAEWFYMNSKRCTTIHYRCIFGVYAYMKPGYTMRDIGDVKVEVVRNDSSSRPMCQTCLLYCTDPLCLKLYKPNGTEFFICSIDCYTMF